MSVLLKALILAALAVVEIAMGFFLWRKFMSEGKPQVAMIMVLQALGTVFFFGFVLFVLIG